MPRELLELTVEEVSLVDQPANMRKFLIIKRVGTMPAADVIKATKKENGKDYPQSDFAFTPDEEPSHWKLRLTATPGGEPDAHIVGAAVAALGPGFRGRKVQIPAAALGAVKAKVKSAWHKANPDKADEELPAVLKNMDDMESVMMQWDDDDDAPPMTTAQRLQEKDFWQQWNRLWGAFCDSVYDIMDCDDDDMGYAPILMQSIQEFSDEAQQIFSGLGLLAKTARALTALIKAGAAVEKVGRVMAGPRLAKLEQAMALLQAIMDEARSGNDIVDDGDASDAQSPPGGKPASQQTAQSFGKQQGDHSMALSPLEVLKQRVALKKKAQLDAETAGNAEQVTVLTGEIVTLEAEMATLQGVTSDPEAEDIWKGVHPTVRKQFEDLQKKAQDAELKADAADKIAKAEREQRERTEYIQKTASYRAVGVQADDWEHLRALDQLPEASKTYWLTKLGSAGELVKKSPWFEERGSNSRSAEDGVSGDAEAEFLAKAKMYAAEQKVELTKAIDATARAYPDLYQRYTVQKRQANRVTANG